MNILLLVILFISISFAQDDFVSWMKAEQENFQQFIKKEDKAFSDFLKKEWVKVSLKKPVKTFSKKKPITLPIAPKRKIVSEKKINIVKEKIIYKKAKRVIPRKKIVASSLTFNFFGTETSLLKKNDLKMLESVSNKGVSLFWKNISKHLTDKFIDLYKSNISYLALNDYGVGVYVKNSSGNYFISENERILFTWYVLTKLGYDTKVGFSGQFVYLLLPSKTALYGLTFFRFLGNNKKYYVMDFNKNVKLNGGLFTYKGDYPNSSKKMDFTLHDYPNFKVQQKSKRLQFKYRNQTYKIHVNYNESIINFLKYYPQTSFEIYVNSKTSSEFSSSILTELQKIIVGKTETEAVNILLRFVQTSLKYKTDDDQFNREKFLFLEETIHYPYSDCEDRSILFAFLVKKLLELKVVGLHYPGHMATAVLFSSRVKGDKIVLKNTTFTVCDPTYINATFGMAMPQFKNILPKVLKID